MRKRKRKGGERESWGRRREDEKGKRGGNRREDEKEKRGGRGKGNREGGEGKMRKDSSGSSGEWVLDNLGSQFLVFQEYRHRLFLPNRRALGIIRDMGFSSLAESKDAVAVTNPLEGKIVHLTEKEGVVGFVPDLQDLQTQHCFFGSGQLFVKQQQISIDNSLLDYVQLGERVKLHGKKIVGFSKTVASFTCRYSAIRVYKQEPTDPAPLFEPLSPVLRSTSPGLWSTSSRSSSGVASSLSALVETEDWLRRRIG
ncbi:unnamed protein product [Cyprideis torosa]|uniref:Uncharacterized protein n=1 Tax=Cyprideis torosa TaxID=163714 RepID=A0A7R8ZX23_9CRUS|nr:unnamed protein product [Cyprideis torosa]CAG0906398.1 unnamed protein product [Cyprideis torosa]